MGQGLPHDGAADNGQRRADILADAGGHQRQIPHADGVEHHGQAGDDAAADHQELLQDGHTAHTVASHAEQQDKQQCHRHHHQYLRRGGNNGVDGQALLDGGIHREHQRQRNGDVGHAAEAGGTEDDAHHHDGNNDEVPPAHFLLENDGAQSEHHQRLDVVAQAALQHPAILDGPQVHQPVTEQQHGGGYLPLEHLPVPEHGPQLGQLALHLQDAQAAHRRPDNAAGHEEKSVDLAAEIGAHKPVQRLKAPEQKAHAHGRKALAVINGLHTYPSLFCRRLGVPPIYSVSELCYDST